MERKEAIEIVKKLYSESLFMKKDKEAMVTLIPELKESEDEKMREMAIKAVYAPEAQSCIKSWGINPDDVIAWLEKQGEQKPIDEVKSKFKVGDWITFCGSEQFKILEVEPEQNGILNYLLLEPSGRSAYHDKKYVDENARLWTIQDAKDGDVLVDNYTIIIFRKIGNYAWDDVVDFYICYSFENGIIVQRHNLHCGSIDSVFFKPATKEQRDLLFQKMHEAGYEWDFEVKELNKIEKKPDDKVEPKFKVGDWVVYNRNDHSREIMQIYDIRDGRYYFNDNVHFSWSIKECDEKSHLWTIQDAKDGDVLVTSFEEDNMIVIYHSMCTIDTINVHCCLDNKFICENLGVFDAEDVKPATKEQRDTLMKSIADAGYEWDFEKKELKKIEQASSWSEDDAVCLGDAMGNIEQAMGNLWRAERWLESVKERIKEK